jgi:Sulfotransferase family
VATPPLLVLGVRRSGTTLLRVMLDRHSQLAVPDESYFIPQLAARHRGRLDVDAFCDDLSRIRTIADWQVPLERVRPALPADARLSDGLRAVYQAYAEARGKWRWGDKTPMYMQYLPLLERLFPDALYVHIVRDGRDAASSFLAMPAGIVTEGWAHPRSASGFACQWRTEVAAARGLARRVGGERYRELRYEGLAADPAAALAEVCEFAGLEFEPAMLEYQGRVDLTGKPHQTSLERPPTPGIRDWRSDMDAGDVAAFESIAGDALAAFRYPLADPVQAAGPSPRGRAELLSYRSRTAAWRAAGEAIARSPLWRRRHPALQAEAGTR